MPILHAWDCVRCRTRNAPQLPRCRQCQASRDHGRPCYREEAALPSFYPADTSQRPRTLLWGLWECLVLLGKCLLFLVILFLVPWPFSLALLAIYLLWLIAAGVSRLADRGR